jgi:hypothetical protein
LDPDLDLELAALPGVFTHAAEPGAPRRLEGTFKNRHYREIVSIRAG